VPRAAERVSRRELKQDDAFVEAMTPLVDQLEKNWKTIAFAVGGALIAVLAAVTILTISAHHDEQAAAQLGNALQDATKQVVAAEDKPDADKPDAKGAKADPKKTDAKDDKDADYFPSEQAKQQALAKSLDGVVQKDKGSPSGLTATLALADADYNLGKYAEAIRSYGAYLAEAPESDTMRAFAMQGQAYALLGEGKGDEALAAAKKLIDSPAASFGRDLGLLATGHIAEQLGKLDAAKDAYSKLSLDYPNTPAGREANDRLTALGVTPPTPAATPGKPPAGAHP
jgi:predicted negative regulator of RcsB-dependent stress response